MTSLATFVDRYTMRHVRIYPHPVERLWEAITDDEQVGKWMGSPITFDLRVGGILGVAPRDELFGRLVDEWLKQKVTNGELPQDLANRYGRELRGVAQWNDLNEIYRNTSRRRSRPGKRQPTRASTARRSSSRPMAPSQRSLTTPSASMK